MTQPFSRDEELIHALYDAMGKCKPIAQQIDYLLSEMSEAHNIIYDVNKTYAEADEALVKKRLRRDDLRAAIARLFKEICKC